MGAASEELTERAKLLIAERRYQEAVRTCRRGLLSRPDSVDVRLLLGEALLALERYDEVRVEMLALTRSAPDSSVALRLLGEAYLRGNRPMQALDVLQRAVELDSDDEIAVELLQEAADEQAPVSSTIERWFGEEADATVETESPSWVEPDTGILSLPATRPEDDEPQPSIQIDPSLRRAEMGNVDPLAGMGSSAPVDDDDTVANDRLDALLQPPGEESSSQAGTVPVQPALPPQNQRETARARIGGARSAARVTEELDALEPISEETPGASPGGSEPDSDDEDSTNTWESLSDGALEPLSAEEHRPRVTRELDRPPAGKEASARPVPAAPRSQAPRRPVRSPNPASGFREPPSSRAKPGSTDAPRAEHGAASPAPAPDAASAAGAPESSAFPPRAHNRHHGRQRSIKTADGSGSALRSARVRATQLLRRVPLTFWKAFALCLGLSVIVVLIWGLSTLLAGASELAELRARAAAAGDSGSRVEIEALLQEIGDPEEPELIALAVRLHATLTLDHDIDHRAQAMMLLERLGPEPPTDAAIGQAFLLIAQGDPDAARRSISGLTAEGDSIAEGYRASALAKYAMRRWDRAAQDAQRALEERPNAPRHLALRALAEHRNGQSAQAITLLEGHPLRNTHPGLRVVLARVLHESTSDPERAAEEANAVLEDLGSAASRPERAWAHLIRGMYRVTQGDRERALADVRAARSYSPRWDDRFGVQLVETMLAVGVGDEALEQLNELPPLGSRDPELRAARSLLTARVALSVGEVDRASLALDSAGEGTDQNLLRARVLEAQGHPEQARPLYQRVLRDPGPAGRRARVRLGEIRLVEGDVTGAIELLDAAQTASPGDLEVVPVLARAYLRASRIDDAARLINAALRQHPDVPELLASQGRVELARGRPGPALSLLRRAAAARPADVGIQVALGDAARSARELDIAETAYRAALVEQPLHGPACLGLARLALETHALSDAETHLEQAERGTASPLEVALGRAELHVVRGDGAIGVAAVSPRAAELRDARLWALLGLLQAQAELDGDARTSFDRALRLDRADPHALVGKALLYLRRGSLSGARSNLRSATQALQRRAGFSRRVTALLGVARARVAFERGDRDATRSLATRALEAQPRFGPASLVLADLEEEGTSAFRQRLREAADGVQPPPEAVGRLAIELERGSDACRYANRYLETAPRGQDAADVRSVASRCR